MAIDAGCVAADEHQLGDVAQSYAARDRAANTRRAYESDWAHFTSWCASVDAAPLPATPATVAEYLAACAPNTAVSTLARRLAAVRNRHREANHAPPESGDLRRVWAGVRRTCGRPPRQKRALTIEDLRKVLRRIPDTIGGKRDRALLLIMFATAFRRSEACALRLGASGDVQVELEPRGAVFRVLKAKGDQEGRGSVFAVPRTRNATCPIAALEAWLQAAGVTEGAVFREVDRHGRVGASALSGQAVADVVKRCVAAAGYDPAGFGGHSPRAGFVTTALGKGVAVADIMRTTRHAKVDTLLKYDREADVFGRSAAGKVGL